MSDEKNKVDTTTEIKNSEMKKADANVKTMEDFTSCLLYTSDAADD